MLCWQVSLPVVRRFVQSVTDQAVGVGVIRGVKPDQQLVKVKFIYCRCIMLFTVLAFLSCLN